MAAVNPSPPEMQAEQFLNYSKPIGNIPANTAAAQTISTLGDAVSGAVTLADSTVKETIKNDIYKKVDPIRDAYTASMEAINNGNPAAPSPAQTGIAPQSILPPDSSTQSVPPSLQSGLDKVSVMAEAARQNGHYNDTQYTAQLTALTKQLRAQYPGYRPYIDEQVSTASGIPIANAYVKNLVEDANRQASATKSEQQRIENLILSRTDLHGQEEMWATYQRDRDPTAVMRWASANDARMNDLKNLKLAQEMDQGNDAANTQAATRYVTAAVGKGATDFFFNKNLTNGQTPAQMSAKINQIAMHPEMADDVATQRLAGQYQAAGAQFVNETMTLLSTPGADGKSVVQKLGSKVVMDQVNQAKEAMFGASSDLLFNKDYPAVHLNQNQNTAIVDNRSHAILGDSKIGGPTADIAAINKIAPQVAPVIFAGITQATTYNTDLGKFTANQKLRALSQRDYFNNGTPYTFSEAMDQQKKYADQNGGDPSGDEFKSLTDLTTAITHKHVTPELQRNAFQFFFDPKNMDNMLKFKEGYYDPSQKRMIQGREAAFAALTSPDITAQAYKQSQMGHPEVWQQYKEWAQHEAGVHLIRNDVANLNDIVQEGEGSTKGAAWHLGWDSDKHHVVVAHADGSPLRGLELTQLNMPYRTTTNINNVLDHMQNIAKAEGGDVDGYFYNVLSNIDGPAADKLRSGMKISASGASKIKGNLSDQPVGAPVRMQ